MHCAGIYVAICRMHRQHKYAGSNIGSCYRSANLHARINGNANPRVNGDSHTRVDGSPNSRDNRNSYTISDHGADGKTHR